MRIDVPSSPPWEATGPNLDLSLTDVRKGDISPAESRSRALALLSSYEDHVFTYTDGSKTTDGVGCAFVVGRNTRSFSLPVHSSVFTSELVAISKALCFIEVGLEVSHLILTDSLSSLLVLGAFIQSIPL